MRHVMVLCDHTHTESYPKHIFNGTGEGKTCLSSNQSQSCLQDSVHLIYMLLVGTGWLCFVLLLLTFTENFPWTKRDLVPGPNLIHSNLFPLRDNTHSGQQSSCGPLSRTEDKDEGMSWPMHISPCCLRNNSERKQSGGGAAEIISLSAARYATGHNWRAGGAPLTPTFSPS